MINKQEVERKEDLHSSTRRIGSHLECWVEQSYTVCCSLKNWNLISELWWWKQMFVKWPFPKQVQVPPLSLQLSTQLVVSKTEMFVTQQLSKTDQNNEQIRIVLVVCDRHQQGENDKIVDKHHRADPLGEVGHWMDVIASNALCLFHTWSNMKVDRNITDGMNEVAVR